MIFCNCALNLYGTLILLDYKVKKLSTYSRLVCQCLITMVTVMGQLTCMTPPPFPDVPAMKSSGRFSILPNQSNITVSSSVQAGLAA